MGQIASRPRPDVKGYTEFHRVGRPVDLSQGEHTLRIVCSGIQGWIDPINCALLSADLDEDYEALQTEHTGTSLPVVVSVGE